MAGELWNKSIHVVTELSALQYWTGLRVWIDRPHLVNRKLLTTEILHCTTLPRTRRSPCIDFNEDDFQRFLSLIENNDSFGTAINNICERFNALSVIEKILIGNDSCEKCSTDDSRNPSFVIRKLIPRNLTKFSEVLELVLIDEIQNIVIFWPKGSDVVQSAITPNFPFRIKFGDNWVAVEIYKNTFGSDIQRKVSEKWLALNVLPKTIKWSNSPSPSTIPSLTLVSGGEYSMKYNYLKEKYAKKYIEIWPEVSDPIKCVYEDIGIAAYLITLWEAEVTDLNLTSMQTFVDLGCGNGLLVELLNSEGYTGIGIDVRKRKIWDLYINKACLIEKSIEPSDYNIFPDYDWIIGNHSDELTPWIPVIAARSSYKMRVFLLPCCAFTFNGKYDRSYPGKTQYQSYLSFIHELCKNMGFDVYLDRLRIPSTKRTCFVSLTRNYAEENERDIDASRKEFIKCHLRMDKVDLCMSGDNKNYVESKETTSSDGNKLKGTHWIENFKPRDRVEKVKNCSQLDREFLNNSVLTVAELLLQTPNFICLDKGSEKVLWNAGGKIKLSDLVCKISSQILKGLKNQHGGVQTFLRNHRNVFQITGEYVLLNIPEKGVPLNSRPAQTKKKRNKQYNFQNKPCFFYFHHPQGCPLEASDCNFSHKTN